MRRHNMLAIAGALVSKYATEVWASNTAPICRLERVATPGLKSTWCGDDCRSLLSALFQRESFFFPGGKAVQ